ncbi:hypothetical protein DIS18_01500 [Algibacter marinivivus]|uniref:DUF4350 domain-containing protein n=1 Tax=Algibacter marinivivus TaxID=2100723 RepID=A0A2U2X631_9FLAO|nr:DUF4350 domain-containing protein [Algibacter marinivivus]PWH83255.1 hypothetical protein DIS18_01500 [Algibacter marinivivus]
MKKILPVLIILVALVITASVVIGVKRTKTVDWEESFDEKSNKPYGVSVLYKELPKLFKDYKVRTVYHQPASYLKANSEDGYGEHIAEGTYIIIGNSDYLEDDSIDELLNFVDAGNTLFLSDYYFPQKIHDTLDVSVNFVENEKDSISYLSLKHVNIDDIKLDRNASDQYFSEFDSINHTVLGHSKIDYKHTNFLQVPFGKGTVFLHTEPKAFTNYHLLKEERYKYIEGILSYLPDNHVYFDSYTKIQTGYDGDVEKESNLGWFLEQLSFKWAWFTAIIFGILFMIFNAKRRQRIIRIIKPLQNTTVAFVKTVSNLYFDTKDHKNLVDKKITYFLEKIRRDLNLNTDVLDEEFIEKLASKTGKKKDDVKKLVNYINLMRSKNEFFEENLIKLNRHIEAFYSK